MSARDDLTRARRHPAATTVTLLLALVFGATVGGLWDGGWSALAALLIVALCASWIAVVANRPDLFAARASDHGGQPRGLRRHLDPWTERPGLQGRLTLPAERAQHDRERAYVQAVARNGCDLPHDHGLRIGPRVVDFRAVGSWPGRRAHFVSAAIQCPEPEGMSEDGYFVTGHVDHPTGARVWRCQRMSFDSVCWWCTGPFALVVEWWHRRHPHPVEEEPHREHS